MIAENKSRFAQRKINKKQSIELLEVKAKKLMIKLSPRNSGKKQTKRKSKTIELSKFAKVQS